MKIFKAFFFLLYRFILAPAALTLLFIFLWPFNKKIKQGLRLRRERHPELQFQKRPIWIHASSGEFEYAKPVISRLKQISPNAPVVVTYFSPSYADAIKKFPGVDAALPLPFDLPGPTRAFLRQLNPALLLVARTDLWPELLSAVHDAKIPSLLFSSSFRPLTSSRALFRPYFKMLFNEFTSIFGVAEVDKRNLESSGTVTPVQVAGDTRYDQVVARLQNPKPLKPELFSATQKSSSLPLMIVGSSWPEDEKALIQGLEKHLKNEKLRLVLAPHEPDDSHLKKIENQLQRFGLSCARYSTANDLGTQVLLVDKVGILAELYAFCDFGFVGGSFRAKVHSVMEPLAAGLPTMVGPFHHNNREALEFQKVAAGPLQAVTAVQNAQDIAAQVDKILKARASWPQTRSDIRAEVSRRTGASLRVLAWVAQHYPDLQPPTF